MMKTRLAPVDALMQRQNEIQSLVAENDARIQELMKRDDEKSKVLKNVNAAL